MATRAFAGLGVPRDLGTGWAFEMKACELQHAPSCARLAVAVRTGVVDGGEAEPWTERARSLLPTQCEQGSAEACETGARLALSGTLELDAGAWLSKTQALEEAGCARGDARACHRLGLALWSGSWSTTDVDAGVQALSRGCTLGLAGACAALGLKFRSGDGLERDPARSMALLHQAALLSADAGH
jgi:TPR repeat protein